MSSVNASGNSPGITAAANTAMDAVNTVAEGVARATTDAASKAQPPAQAADGAIDTPPSQTVTRIEFPVSRVPMIVPT